MTKVIFVSGFKSIAAGTEVTLSPTGISYTGCGCVTNLTLNEVNALVSLGLARIEEVVEVVRVPFAPKAGASMEKVSKAMAEDMNKFFIGEAYEFYKVETNEWVVSTLLNTASHIGRVSAGFAVPAGASDKKKIHRLTSLNEIYSLWLSKEEIADAVN